MFSLEEGINSQKGRKESNDGSDNDIIISLLPTNSPLFGTQENGREHSVFFPSRSELNDDVVCHFINMPLPEIQNYKNGILFCILSLLGAQDEDTQHPSFPALKEGLETTTTTTMATTTSSRTLLCSSYALLSSSNPCTAKCSLHLPQLRRFRPLDNTLSLCSKPLIPKMKDLKSRALSCHATRRKPTVSTASSGEEGDDNTRRVLQTVLWIAEGIYIGWLFLLPFAPGDPVWAISKDTVTSLVGLSLNFFFILPFLNFAGVHVMEAPVLHPMSEGLFNFVIGWTFMFAPLLFTDRKRNRYKGSLDVLWGLQMFLTNTFLIPYMAIRLNDADDDDIQSERSQLGTVMTNGAPIVGIIGGGACLLSLWWALFGRMDVNFGGITERWDYLLDYLGSERLAYAFIWDICLYIIFQPWLIGENLQNVQETKVSAVKYLSYVPVVGLIAYLLCLDEEAV